MAAHIGSSHGLHVIFRIKENFWTWSDDFVITDHEGAPRFRVRGKVFSWGDNLSFQDAAGRQIAVIRQTLMSWRPTYEILVEDAPFAKLVKEWSWFGAKFTLDVPGPNDYEIAGSFWQHEFVFRRAGREVARVSKEHWAWTDSYGVEIVDGEDVVAILCACIVVDQILHDGDRD